MVNMTSGRTGRFLLSAILLVAMSTNGAARCTVERYGNGTGPSRAGCPTPKHGNYYAVGRRLVQDYYPIFQTFIELEYDPTDPDGAPSDLKTAVRDFVARKMRGLLNPFSDFRCRCDNSVLDPAKELRDALIGAPDFDTGYVDLVNFTTSPTNLEFIQAMQTFVATNIEALSELRCTPTLRDVRRNPSFAYTQSDSACIFTYRRRGARITRCTVRCPTNTCDTRDYADEVV